MSNDQNITRKLKAILSADVKGYSLLMSDDEVLTLKTLNEYRDIMSELIQGNSGRVVDSVGDNMLAEFSSAVDAVGCAVKIQNRLKDENSKYADHRKLQFRIGINIGDVIHQDGRIIGEGVNIASRIEGLADAGGICISHNTYDQIEGKLDIQTKYLGEHQVKNIKKPVRVYKILMDSDSYEPLVEEKYDLPDNPSLAVLPFDNMSGDPDQEYFSDGLTEQIINGLCKVSNLFVIARNSSFAYKGKTVSVKQIAKELGVKYILEGSVQRAGNRVRITAQLINAETDFHMLSETYDKDLSDIFALQDEITMKLILALGIKLVHGEQEHIWGKAQTNNYQAFDELSKGIACLYRHNKQYNFQAIHHFEKSITLDDKYSMAYALMGMAHVANLYFGYSESPIDTFEQADKCAKKALELDSSTDLPYITIANLDVLKKDYDKAIAEGKRAIELNPNGAEAYFTLAVIYIFSDKPEKALLLINKAMRLNPIPQPRYLTILGLTLRLVGQYDDAIDICNKSITINPENVPAYLQLIASCIANNRYEDAQKAARQILRITPEFSVNNFANSLPYRNSQVLEDYMSALRKAGLPD